jgi:hypothetical protein
LTRQLRLNAFQHDDEAASLAQLRFGPDASSWRSLQPGINDSGNHSGVIVLPRLMAAHKKNSPHRRAHRPGDTSLGGSTTTVSGRFCGGRSCRRLLVGVLVSMLGVLMCSLTVFVSGNSVLLCFFVLSNFVMMDSFVVVVCRCLVMPGCIVVVLAGGVFHGHGMVLSKSVLTIGGRPFRKDSGKRCVRRHRAMRLRRAASKLRHCSAENNDLRTLAIPSGVSWPLSGPTCLRDAACCGCCLRAVDRAGPFRRLVQCSSTHRSLSLNLPAIGLDEM